MWSPGGSPHGAKGDFPVHSFVSLGLLPLGGRAGLTVGTIVRAGGERWVSKKNKKCLDCLAFTVGVKSAFQLPRLN